MNKQYLYFRLKRKTYNFWLKRKKYFVSYVSTSFSVKINTVNEISWVLLCNLRLSTLLCCEIACTQHVRSKGVHEADTTSTRIALMPDENFLATHTCTHTHTFIYVHAQYKNFYVIYIHMLHTRSNEYRTSLHLPLCFGEADEEVYRSQVGKFIHLFIFHLML